MIYFFNLLEEGIDNEPNLIVIATPSALHFDAAERVADKSIIKFSKKISHNLDSLSDLDNFVLGKNYTFLFLSSRNFIFILEKLKKNWQL